METYTLLEKEKIIGKKKSLIFKKYGTQAAITDFAILLGGYVSEDIVASSNKVKKLMSAPWWTKTEEDKNIVYITCKNRESDNAPISATQIGIRPAAQYLSIFKDSLIDYIKEENSVKETRYGEYPQWITEDALNNKLETLYNLDVIIKTGKVYNIDKKYVEYEYNGNNYIRFNSESKTNKRLSNGKTVEQKPYWIRVSPIEWITSTSENLIISKYILVSGIKYSNKKDDNYEKSNIKKFLDESFEKDIIPSEKKTISQSKTQYIEELIKAKQELRNIKNAINEIKKIYSNKEELSEEEEKSKKYILEILK